MFCPHCGMKECVCSDRDVEPLQPGSILTVVPDRERPAPPAQWAWEPSGNRCALWNGPGFIASIVEEEGIEEPHLQVLEFGEATSLPLSVVRALLDDFGDPDSACRCGLGGKIEPYRHALDCPVWTNT